ncbi:MAG: hypothetical protein ACLFU6_01355 [Candidatus Hydrogenedentota bacterium]
MTHRNNRGYSLIELAILFVILLIVSIFVFASRDLFFGGPPRSHTEDLGVAVIRMGIANYGKQSEEENRTPVYPLRLDEAPSGTEASRETPLFTRVVPEGIRSGWRKEAANEYVYLPEGDQGAMEQTYYYDPVTGGFDHEPPESRQVQFTRRIEPETAPGVKVGAPLRMALDVPYERNPGYTP